MQCDEALDRGEPRVPRVSSRRPGDSAGNSMDEEGWDPPQPRLVPRLMIKTGAENCSSFLSNLP